MTTFIDIFYFTLISIIGLFFLILTFYYLTTPGVLIQSIVSTLLSIILVILFSTSLSTITQNRRSESYYYHYYSEMNESFRETISLSTSLSEDFINNVAIYNINLRRIQAAFLDPAYGINFTHQYDWTLLSPIDLTK